MRTLALVLSVLVAAPLQAQDWATPEVCFVDQPEIHAEALAPATLEELVAEAKAIPNATGRYWRITAPGGAVSHLWGTMHSNDPLILALPERVESDIRSARAVAVEADFVFRSREDYTSFANAEDIIRRDDFPSRFGLLGLPDEVQDWIRMRTEGIGWGADAPDYLTLAGLAAMLLSDPCSDFAGGVYPVQDSLIQTFGAIEGAEIVGLEDPDAFNDTLREPGNFELLRAIIAIYGAYLNPERDAAATSTGYALYLQGRIGVSMALDRAYIEHLYGAEQAEAWLGLTNGYLVEQRNRDFLSRALPELNKGGVVMAIGSFHLPGENGMVEMLRRAGFTVERVRLPGEVEG